MMDLLRSSSRHHSLLQMKTMVITLALSSWAAFQIHAASADEWTNAAPEYPRESGAATDGWVEMSGVYKAPPGATRARVELHLLWAPNGKVEWSDVSFLPTEPPLPRKVRLASVHYRPRGAKTLIDACRQFAPLIEEASRRKADLVVLGETLTYAAGVGSSYADCAESIPGPSTDYF